MSYRRRVGRIVLGRFHNPSFFCCLFFLQNCVTLNFVILIYASMKNKLKNTKIKLKLIKFKVISGYNKMAE